MKTLSVRALCWDNFGGMSGCFAEGSEDGDASSAPVQKQQEHP